MNPEIVADALGSDEVWSLNQYQTLATRTLNKKLDQKMGLMHSAALVGADGGEYLSAVKAHVFYGKALAAPHGDQPGATLKDNMIEEMGDVLWGLAEGCTRLGVTLEDVARFNMSKLLKRFPFLYSDEAAIARVDKK